MLRPELRRRPLEQWRSDFPKTKKASLHYFQVGVILVHTPTSDHRILGGVDQGNSTRCHLSHVCQCYLQQGWPPSLNLAKGRTFRTEFYHSQHLTGSADLQTPVILMVISPFRGRRCFVVRLLLLKFSCFFCQSKGKTVWRCMETVPGDRIRV